MNKEQLQIARKIAEIEFGSANYTIRIISGTVIVENKIDLLHVYSGGNAVKAAHTSDIGPVIDFTHKNPLRAAAIVYLLMQETN